MLVNCVAYEGGHRLADIPLEDLPAYLERPGCFVWVAIANPEPHELAALEEPFALHELAVEDTMVGHERPKIEEYEHFVFAVLHMIEIRDADLALGEVAIFAGRNYVLSVRRAAERGFADVRQRCEREPELLALGPGYVLYALMDAVVDRYFPALDGIATEIEAVEETIFTSEPTRESIEAIYGLKRKLLHLKHAVEPLLEASHRLHGGHVPGVCSGLEDYFRDVSDHLARLNQAIDTLSDTVTTVISVALSLITISDNETTKRLASYAALVAAPALVAGIYGMNFEHMPELSWAGGYPLALGLMAAIDGFLAYRFRKANWL